MNAIKKALLILIGWGPLTLFMSAFMDISLYRDYGAFVTIGFTLCVVFYGVMHQASFEEDK